MATNVQNFTAIINALLDEGSGTPTATNSQLTAIGDAYIAQATNAQIVALFPGAVLNANGEVDKAALSPSERTKIILVRWRGEVRNVIKQVRRDADLVSADALLSAGQASAGAVI